jgi:hypothetical protein
MGTLPGILLFAALSHSLAIAPPGVPERIEQLKGEPVSSVRLAFQRQDPRLYWTQVYDKIPLDGDTSLLLVESAPLVESARPGSLHPDRNRSRFGLFAVSGPGNVVESVLDIMQAPHPDLVPVLEPPASGRVYLHWHTSQGAYLTSVRYLYTAGASNPAPRTAYGRFGIQFVAADGPRLYYRARYEQPAQRPAGVNGLPAQSMGLILDIETGEFTLTSTPPSPLAPRPAPPWVSRRLPGLLRQQTAIGEPVRLRRTLWAQVTTAGLHLLSPTAPPAFYPNPAVPERQFAELRPDIAPHNRRTMHSGFGPLALRGDTLWFANSFPESPTQSGLGLLGRLTLGEPQLDLRPLPEIACCSGSALHVTEDGDEAVYAGLMTRAPGGDAARGLLRYHPGTGESRLFPVTGVIQDIRPAGRALALAATDGLYLLEGETLVHYRIEPDADDGLALVTIALPYPDAPPSRR